LEASKVIYLESARETGEWGGVAGDWGGLVDLVGEPSASSASALLTVLQDGKQLAIDDVDQAANIPGLKEQLRAADIAAIVCAPLIKDGKLIAVMAVHQNEKRAWTPDELDLVRIFCERCGSEIERIRAQLDLQQREHELRRLNQELDQRVRERTSELTIANQEMERFSYSVAHDLRAPLRSIIATSRILLEDCENLTAEERELLERQAFSANRLSQLMDAILNLSQINRKEPKKVTFDFSALASEVASDLKAGLCEIRVTPGLFAFGDPLLIRLVLLNLMENACKFSPSGGVVEVGQENVHGQPAYFVSDQGIGFDQELAQKVFEPFKRLVHETDFAGTGIGLANVKRIVLRQGGAVWVESTLGKGSTFYFTLPPEDAPVKVEEVKV
jgi:signal transduction histidine kinase